MSGGSGVHASRFLRTTGRHATIEPDAFTDGGYVLSIGGSEQSHVNLDRPEDIFYEYLRRVGHGAALRLHGRRAEEGGATGTGTATGLVFHRAQPLRWG